MSKIIFLNGCGSSGKTSIARSIQHLSEDLWLTFGVDTFLDMILYTKEDNYCSFVPGSNEHGPTMHIETKPEGASLFGAMPDFAKLLAEKRHNLIIDEVLFDDEILQKYAQSLRNHTIYYVGVFCDLAKMQEREILRRDRGIGLSNDQINRVHLGLRSHYDFKVDTTSISSFEAARRILEYINNNANPESFNTILLKASYR